MLKFGHFVSWSFCVIFVFKEKKWAHPINQGGLSI